MTDTPRLIEHAFPLKQASIDGVHEKNVRHGHISTLHIWPARRPLAACRAALIATLLPDPSAAPKPNGMSDMQWEEEVKLRRKELCEKIGGRVVSKVEKKRMPNGQVVERVKEETEGGVLHWGRETENAETLEWFRQEIRKACGGRAPRVLDPFAGGGAIPLEAMRLGCETTAIDINPVAWFILKCTLEYPQELGGQTRELPDFILHDDDFMRGFFGKCKGYGKAETTAAMKRLHDRLKKKAKESSEDTQGGLPFAPADGSDSDELQADLAWHVRAWGQWVLAHARKELTRFYPTYADFEALDEGKIAFERQPMRLVPLRDDGTAHVDALNAECSEDYLADKRNPRWVAKPTVAYLWARTVTCKHCRAEVPLLRTKWLSKEAAHRVIVDFRPRPDGAGVDFVVQRDVPHEGGNNAARREHDRRTGLGTMSRSGVRCPCCDVINTTEDIQQAGLSRGIAERLVAVVIEQRGRKEFRLPTEAEVAALYAAGEELASATARDSIGPLTEPIDPRRPSPNSRGLSGLTRYGFCTFSQVFNPRQQLVLFVLCQRLSRLRLELSGLGYETVWADAVCDYLATAVDKVADYNSSFCTWHINRQTIGHTFARYALPMTSDYAESNPIGEMTGSLGSAVSWTGLVISHLTVAASESVHLIHGSADDDHGRLFDLIVTDPPYYDSIPYSDISDFFYVWLRRAVAQRYPKSFATPLVDREREIIQHAGRHDGDNQRAKQFYEDGMARAFQQATKALSTEGRLVVVFAHKQPDAWEALASSLIKAGCTVQASWPIQTEMPNKTAGGARLASSVWLVCRKRPATARPGWDNSVLAEMRKNVAQQLREFWDAGIRGPDFVWAATGPAMEAYSKHPIVKKADCPDEIMTVSEFLMHVRRMVVDFVVGRVLSGDGEAADEASADRLDEPTAYYLLHRHDFGMEDAPAGTCILYAVSCGLSDKELVDTWDILAHTGGAGAASSENGDDDEDETAADDRTEEEEGSGSKLKLKTWAHRKARSMGYEAPGGKPVPLIDRVHRLMHLWKTQDVHKVDEYLDDNALRRHELFKRLMQSLIELSPQGSDERSLLESLSNHVGSKGARREKGPDLLDKLPAGEGEAGK